MSPVDPVAIVPLRRQRPHVDEVADWNAQQSMSLLWDRLFSLQEQLTAAQATITRLIDEQNTTSETLADVERTATEALAQAASGGTGAGGEEGAGGEGEGGLPDGGDGGSVQEGINAGLPTGHDSGGSLSGVRAGQIIGGTGNEFAALKNPTPTVDERLANAEELLRRIIWHLHEAGFEAGKQKNPSGLISRDKMTVVVDSVLRVYDIYISFDDNTIPLVIAGNEVPLPVLVAEEGIPDS